MPANTLLPSVVGNIQATRDKLSAVRQRIGLEPSGPMLKALAPSPPNGPAMDAPNPVAEAFNIKPQTPAQTTPVPTQGQEPDYDNYQMNPDKRSQLAARAAEFMDMYGARQQSNIADPRPEMGGPGGIPDQPHEFISDPKLTQALAPMATFYNENGRLPTPAELHELKVDQLLTEELGRKPTATERRIYLMRPDMKPRKVEKKPV